MWFSNSTSKYVCVYVYQSFSHVWFFATPWTVPARLLRPWGFPGKNTGVGRHFLLQGIFPTQVSHSADSLPSEPPGNFSGYTFKRNESWNSDICTIVFIAAWSTSAKRWKQPKCPSTEEWMHKKWNIHTALNRKESLTAATMWMMWWMWCSVKRACHKWGFHI